MLDKRTFCFDGCQENVLLDGKENLWWTARKMFWWTVRKMFWWTARKFYKGRQGNFFKGRQGKCFGGRQGKCFGGQQGKCLCEKSRMPPNQMYLQRTKNSTLLNTTQLLHSSALSLCICMDLIETHKTLAYLNGLYWSLFLAYLTGCIGVHWGFGRFLQKLPVHVVPCRSLCPLLWFGIQAKVGNWMENSEQFWIRRLVSTDGLTGWLDPGKQGPPLLTLPPNLHFPSPLWEVYGRHTAL